MISLQASSPFGGVARSHARAARKTRVQGAFLILRTSRLALLATRNGELARRLEDELFIVDVHGTDTKRMKLQK